MQFKSGYRIVNFLLHLNVKGKAAPIGRKGGCESTGRQIIFLVNCFQRPEAKYKGKINGIEIEILVDTGIDLSTISL